MSITWFGILHLARKKLLLHNVAVVSGWIFLLEWQKSSFMTSKWYKKIIQVLSDTENWLNYVNYMIVILVFCKKTLLMHVFAIGLGKIFIIEWQIPSLMLSKWSKKIIQVLSDIENWLNYVNYMIRGSLYLARKNTVSCNCSYFKKNLHSWMTNTISYVIKAVPKNYSSTFWHWKLIELCELHD